MNKAPIRDDRHGTLTWGAAQAGVADGVVAALQDGTVDRDAIASLVLIVAVWVAPSAADAAAIQANNRDATHAALTAGRRGEPTVDRLLAAGEAWNPYFARR